MGLTGQNQILWKSAAISFDNVIYFIDTHHKTRKDSGSINRERPRISVDVSLLAYKFLYRPPFSASHGVMEIARSFADRGIDVILDLDGENRHHSKRAYVDRRAKMDRNRIDLIQHRADLAQILNTPNHDSDMQANLNALVKDIQSKEKNIAVKLPKDLFDDLKNFAEVYEGTSGSRITVSQTLWQADPTIAKRAIDGEVDVIISGDSDFSMYVGTSGPDSLADIMQAIYYQERWVEIF